MPPKQDRRKDTQRTESRSNLVGKFTTSVRRLVKEVDHDHSREGAVQTNDRIRNVTQIVSESYSTVKSALTTLHQQYESSKSERNIFHRYNLLKAMLKSVIRLDNQYWLLVDIPRQEKQEQVTVYVLRACAALEKTAESRTETRNQSSKNVENGSREGRFDGSSVQEIEGENTQLINDLYRLLKKYSSLKKIVHELHIAYRDSKMYPIIPRYTMLKEMIKDVLRDPNYMEVCHEAG